MEEEGGMDSEMEMDFSNTKEEFDEVRDRAVREKGIVMPGLAEKEVVVVKVDRHDFIGNRPLKQAEEWAKNNLVGSHKATDNAGNVFDYNISSKAVGKYLSESATGKSENLGVHLAVLKKLPNVIGESAEVEIHPDYYKGEDDIRRPENGYNDSRLVHRFYGAVNIDGKIYSVKTTIIENRDEKPNSPHSYEVTDIKLADAENTDQLMEPTESPRVGVAKLIENVDKSYDDGKKLLEESKKSDSGQGYDGRLPRKGRMRLRR